MARNKCFALHSPFVVSDVGADPGMDQGFGHEGKLGREENELEIDG
jgi:hypothetical protein